MKTRRDFLRSAAAASIATTIRSAPASFPSKRPPIAQRKFVSEAVESKIATVKQQIGNPKLAWLFENCLPNTLDTTVHFNGSNAHPDTFVITGDIDAMWLRDSSAQVWPYLRFVRDDAHLRNMIAGVIRRQSRCIQLDPYANAFLPGPSSPGLKWSVHDKTEHKPGVGERKWEVDSLCYPIRLAYGYWKASGDTKPFDDHWTAGAKLTVDTFRTQQRKNGPGRYRFQRESDSSTETLALDGLGNPAVPAGMIFSMFRPSDDACILPLFVPANLFAASSLRKLAEMAGVVCSDTQLPNDANALADEVTAALEKFGHMPDQTWAYEVDGYGGQIFMDDANVPSLLSLPYLGCCDASDATYQRTRTRVLSKSNPYYFEGTAAAGIGSPHTGLNQIWPISIAMQALTSSDDEEIRHCLDLLMATDAGTGFMHESFDMNNPGKFTRTWFAWANSLFGELILHLAENKPHLLTQ